MSELTNESPSLQEITRSVPESARHRAFAYHLQSLEGQSSSWEEMMKNLEPDGEKEIKGFVFNDGEIVWSDDVPAHAFLCEAVGRDYKDVIIQIQSIYRKKSEIPTLWLGVKEGSQAPIEKLTQYFQRNINPEVSSDILVGDMEYTGSQPKQIHLGGTK